MTPQVLEDEIGQVKVTLDDLWQRCLRLCEMKPEHIHVVAEGNEHIHTAEKLALASVRLAHLAQRLNAEGFKHEREGR